MCAGRRYQCYIVYGQQLLPPVPVVFPDWNHDSFDRVMGCHCHKERAEAVLFLEADSAIGGRWILAPEGESERSCFCEKKTDHGQCEKD